MFSPVRDVVFRSRRLIHRTTLLASVSALTLLVHATPAEAVCVGRCGGGGATSAATAAASAAISSTQQAAALTQQSMNSLTRATQAVQAMQAVQSAARAAAAAGPNNLGADPNHPGLRLPDVPDGLNAGGLVPDSGLAAPGLANAVTSWVNAGTPTQTVSGGQTLVAIQQTAPQAVLNWTTFNVGKNTIVNFNQQGNAGWIALNKISDPSGVPSQILGRIRADGQVLLINQNGIIFGGSSQINVNALVASTLDDSKLNTNNYQLFLQNGLFSSSVPSGFTGSGAAIFDTPGSQGTGAVTVQPGAIINASADAGAAGNGGDRQLSTQWRQPFQMIAENVALAAAVSEKAGEESARHTVWRPREDSNLRPSA
jgi:filamentous hemagglutinin family protein